MTDEEINQYLEVIKPKFSTAIKAALSRIKDKLKEIQDHSETIYALKNHLTDDGEVEKLINREQIRKGE